MSVRISHTDDLARCLDLRRKVFIDEQGVSEADERDDYDASAIHLLARDGDLPVGTARIVLNGPVGKIGRVCVLKPYRGTGLGAGLIRFALAYLEANPDLHTARLGAQTHALGFYQRLGFTVIGDEYQDAGIPHYDMERAV
jgi:predicted GNAT family N-acyltransferase